MTCFYDVVPRKHRFNPANRAFLKAEALREHNAKQSVMAAQRAAQLKRQPERAQIAEPERTGAEADASP